MSNRRDGGDAKRDADPNAGPSERLGARSKADQAGGRKQQRNDSADRGGVR